MASRPAISLRISPRFREDSKGVFMKLMMNMFDKTIRSAMMHMFNETHISGMMHMFNETPMSAMMHICN